MGKNNHSLLRMFYSIKTLKLSDLFSEDISFAEYAMLELITEIADKTGSPDVWVTDIVKQVDVTPQAVSKFINLAAGKGYIERFDNSDDRRSIGVRITDLGNAVQEKSHEELTAFRKSVCKEFSKDELVAMQELMGKFLVAAQANYAKYKKK
jgi:DNA-binding MarR family transcriptional regulator